MINKVNILNNLSKMYNASTLRPGCKQNLDGGVNTL